MRVVDEFVVSTSVTDIKSPFARRSTSECNHFPSRPSFWSYLAAVKNSRWYLRRFKSVIMLTNTNTHTNTHKRTLVTLLKTTHLATISLRGCKYLLGGQLELDQAIYLPSTVIHGRKITRAIFLRYVCCLVELVAIRQQLADVESLNSAITSHLSIQKYRGSRRPTRYAAVPAVSDVSWSLDIDLVGRCHVCTQPDQWIVYLLYYIKTVVFQLGIPDLFLDITSV